MPSRLRPTRIENIIDGKRLRDQLSAAAARASGDATEQRRLALDILREALSRGRLIVKERLDNGAGGLETARLLSSITDEAITALYDFTTVHVFRARNPTEGERLALMAVGGYGRGTLAPFSDVDLLFLRPYKPTPHGESVIEFMLHALWDLGFKVGYASRTVDECLKLARADFTIRTAVLEARRLSGDERLAADLVHRFRGELVHGTGAEFVAAKLRERDERHARAGASRYMVEPNVKEGKGALRDLNTLFWIAQYLHPAEARDGVVQLEMFNKAEIATFVRAFDFLWAVRCHMHFATGRAEERLTFDLQPEIARRMGYGDRGDAPAVERFMRRYFITAKEVGALTRGFCAKLEAEQAKTRSSGLSRFLPSRGPKRRKLDAPGFVDEGGRLNVKPDLFSKDPVNLLRLFGLADRLDLDLHPDAFTAVTRSLGLITPRVRRDPDAVSAFLEVLARGRHTLRILTLMNESGVLGRFIPEFGRIVAQMQFNMYHSYTVDEHTLKAVGVISDIFSGRLEEDHPLSVSVAPMIADREALFLAMLMHDTGKGKAEGQEAGGAKAARAACTRMGLEPERTALVAWLVQNHLVMSDYAQKRDVSDPRTVEAFARIVETPERLRALLILTVADIRAVGPGVWNAWKGQLMRELYGATLSWFRGARASRAPGLEQPAPVMAPEPERDAAAAAFVATMEDAYRGGFDRQTRADHAELATAAVERGGAAASARLRPDMATAELTVAATDRPGLFADLTSAMAGLGANVVGARLYTSKSGRALDVFYLQDALGEAYGGEDPHVLRRLCATIEASANGTTQILSDQAGLADRRGAAFAITAVVGLDNGASDDCTVVEASGRDRRGLLGALARAMAAAGVSVQSAHIDNYGERAVDAFYVQGPGRSKLTPAGGEALRAALLKVLEEDEAAVLKPRRLQRARASVAR
jgi:[protein-PII] uridylyltransferase